MCSYSSSTAERKLEHRRCGSAKEVLPVDWINVSGTGVSVAWVFLSLLAAMVGIVESHNKSLDSIASLLHINQHSSAAVCQSIKGIHIVDKDDFSSNLQLQHSLERSIFDASSIVGLE